MSLQEITKGIYALNQKTLNHKTHNQNVQSSTNPPALCVHPFYLFSQGFIPLENHRNAFHESNPEKYRYDLLEFMRTSKDTIITLEEEKRFWDTVALLNSLQPQGRRIMIKTQPYDDKPLETTYDSIHALLTEHGTQSSILCMGGYLNATGSAPIRTMAEFQKASAHTMLYGCLGHCMDTLMRLRMDSPIIMVPKFNLIYSI
jgi:hypothetical protein